jgi:glyoxylase-like metal-dependent hydrolase (beta-lactamase superfamily II)
MLEEGAAVTVLDVRPAAERAEWFVPGSIHYDAYERLKRGDPDALDGVKLPAGRPVVTICAAGATSVLAARLLERRGFEVRSLAGGMKGWSLAWNTAEISGPDVSLIQIRRTGKGCLSYVLASGADAVVVDASLDPEVYVDLARARGWTIRHVIDTHIHADHLSRSRDLAERTRATLLLPAQRRVKFRYTPVRDGDEIHVGSRTLRAMHTPGHTPESMCYLMDERWLLTGDTLFLAAVGRPDLEATPEQARARALDLHGSLGRLFRLDPDLTVLPAHASSPVAFDRTPVAATLAAVRQAVRLPGDPAAFADHVLSRLPASPPNHHTIVGYNEAGELPSTDPTDLEAGANRCAIG